MVAIFAAKKKNGLPSWLTVPTFQSKVNKIVLKPVYQGQIYVHQCYHRSLRWQSSQIRQRRQPEQDCVPVPYQNQNKDYLWTQLIMYHDLLVDVETHPSCWTALMIAVGGFYCFCAMCTPEGLTWSRCKRNKSLGKPLNLMFIALTKFKAWCGFFGSWLLCG